MHVTLARALYQAALSLVGLHLARRNAQHANQGLSPAHPRYNDAAALLVEAFAHAAKSRTVSRRWRDFVVEESVRRRLRGAEEKVALREGAGTIRKARPDLCSGGARRWGQQGRGESMTVFFCHAVRWIYSEAGVVINFADAG